jgi:hypothetical protein
MRIARLDCHSAIVLLLDRQEEKLCVPTNNVGSWPLNVAGRFTGCKTLQMVAGLRFVNYRRRTSLESKA